MTQRILLIDNYDSFTFNLKHYVEDLNVECIVFRNDEITVELAGRYDAIIFSPGPGLPEEAGSMLEIIGQLKTSKKMLGVCLGHQAMAVALGGRLKSLKSVMHGVKRSCRVTLPSSALYKEVPEVFDAGRYHSWVVDPETLPEQWMVTSVDDEGNIMSMEHHSLPLFGVQYHPESIMTPSGRQILSNWLKV